MTSPEGKPLDNESREPKLSRRQMLALPIIAAAPNLTQAAQGRWHQQGHPPSVAPGRILPVRNGPHGPARSQRLRGKGLTDLIVDGLEEINKLMQDPDPMVRLRAAQVAVILGIRVYNAEKYRNRGGTTEGNSHTTSTDP